MEHHLSFLFDRLLRSDLSDSGMIVRWNLFWFSYLLLVVQPYGHENGCWLFVISILSVGMNFPIKTSQSYLGFLPSALLYLWLRLSHFFDASHRAFFTKFSLQRFFVQSISPKTLRTSAKLIFDKKILAICWEEPSFQQQLFIIKKTISSWTLHGNPLVQRSNQG